ncbi:hypothetical protein A8W25_06240 [Streptomyces sp. ERV7]|uniref:hypothetical protein n=1 Tax=Streptomyces sp. ERV7 TaxID=1322334 RepID=UPI0007F4634B|nr:hypothetical protein [Streptomyces sp. ERV7]OAR25245.1 hypothetical protein A8W25_06240 [Streptomyces sp. ERV7]
MPYETGATVKLARDVQVSANDTAVRVGFPGPLFLAEGLEGIVTGATKEATGFAQQQAALLDQQIRAALLAGFAADLVDQLRRQIIGHGAYDAGVGAQITYKVRFANGFVLDGLGEDWLTEA